MAFLLEYNILKIFFQLFLLSIILRYSLIFVHQSWVKTLSQTATILLLPIITFVVTKVISSNIALSLGMVGALSIVRFRNPVRSPLELAVYFALITSGIAASENINWSRILIISFSGALILMRCIAHLYQYYFNTEIFKASFNDGSIPSTLEIVASSKIKNLEMEQSLSSACQSKSDVNYLFTSDDFKALKKIYDKYSNNPKVNKIIIRK